MPSQRQKEQCWVCFIMINLNPRRRPKSPHSCMEGKHNMTTKLVFVTYACTNTQSYSACLCVFVARTLLAGRGEFFTEKVKTWRGFSWKLLPITSLQQRSPTPLRRNWLPMQNLLQSKRGLFFNPTLIISSPKVLLRSTASLIF